MSDTKQKALAYLQANADTKQVFATTDGFLFLKHGDALEHALILAPDDPLVETFNREDADQSEQTEPNAEQLEGKDTNPAENPKPETLESTEVQDDALTADQSEQPETAVEQQAEAIEETKAVVSKKAKRTTAKK